MLQRVTCCVLGMDRLAMETRDAVQTLPRDPIVVTSEVDHIDVIIRPLLLMILHFGLA